MALACEDLVAATCPGHEARELVRQIWRQPALYGLDIRAFSRRVIFDLVALDLADCEILCFGMRKIESTDTCPRMHRERFRKHHARIILRMQKIEKRRLFRVIRGG